MQNTHVIRLAKACGLFLFSAVIVAGGNLFAADEVPAGFTALFNGQDISGWWGATTEDPRAYEALSTADFQKKHDASLADIRQHW